MRDKGIELDGAVVAVTGGARGIGAATLRAFRDRGATVVAGDLDVEAARATAEELGGSGYELDVRSRESFSGFLDRVESDHGPPAVLVNNAGIMPLGLIAEEEEALTRAVLEVNLLGMINGCRLAVPAMAARGRGHIVNVVSYLAKMPAAGVTVYCASKFGALGFSESLSDELRGTGVSVSAVLPSAVRTELVAGVRLGGWLPAVEPERIAGSIVKTCRTRAPVVRVPGWMRFYELLAALTPDRALGAGRRRLAADRLAGIDLTERRSYQERIRQVAGSETRGDLR